MGSNDEILADEAEQEVKKRKLALDADNVILGKSDDKLIKGNFLSPALRLRFPHLIARRSNSAQPCV